MILMRESLSVPRPFMEGLSSEESYWTGVCNRPQKLVSRLTSVLIQVPFWSFMGREGNILPLFIVEVGQNVDTGDLILWFRWLFQYSEHHTEHQNWCILSPTSFHPLSWTCRECHEQETLWKKLDQMPRAASIPSCEANSSLILKHHCGSSNEDLETISQLDKRSLNHKRHNMSLGFSVLCRGLGVLP